MIDLSGGADMPFVSGTVWVHDRRGTCIELDGVNGLTTTSAKPLPHARGSFSIWVSDTYGAGVGNEGTYICLHDGSNDNRIQFLTGSDEKFKLGIRVADVAVDVWTEDAHPLTASQIYHLVATWDTVSDSYIVYRDGIVVTPTATDVSDAPTGLTGVSLGCLHDTTFWPLKGKILRASVYNRILTPSEALLLFELQKKLVA
ncbi:MAG: LamG-like jellyroll fold domain-containing protein [Planctomycetota bacterium]